MVFDIKKANEEITKQALEKQALETEFETISSKAKEYVSKLTTSVLEKITSKYGATKEYYVNRYVGISPFSKNREQKTTLEKELKGFAEQPLLLAEFVKENPKLFGLSQERADAFHQKKTHGLHHGKFSDAFDNQLTISISGFKREQNGWLKVQDPVKKKSGAETYSKIIQISVKSLAPLKQVA